MYFTYTAKATDITCNSFPEENKYDLSTAAAPSSQNTL